MEPKTEKKAVDHDNVVPVLVLLSSEVIKKDQDSIRVSLTKLDTAIHANAVQCLLHAEKHGDTSLMRRLLVDIVDAKSGYRRQGLIAWMRAFSPMELHGDNIKLTGTIDGVPIPFNVDKANMTPFTDLASAKELVPMKPVFRDNLTSQLERSLKAYRTSIENTKIDNGKVIGPVDAKKAFYDGIHLDKMDAAFDKIAQIIAEMNSFKDDTKDVRAARDVIAKANMTLAQAEAADVPLAPVENVEEPAQ